MSEKVIVTGAAGFIGSHLCEALLDGDHEVVGIDAFTANYDVSIKRENVRAFTDHERFTLIESSLGELDLPRVIADARYVFHLAAQPGVRESWHERFDEYINANIRATHRLCEACKGAPLKKFVYASSSSVYGETAQLPMSESHPTRPLSPYGVTKLSGENLCLLYRENFKLPVVSLRFFTVYGPRQRPDMAFHRFAWRAMDGQPIDVFGNGTQTRDFTYVSDIVAANLLAMEYDGDESVFNIGGGSRVTLNSAIDLIVEALPDHTEVRYNDPVKGDVSHTYADVSLAKRELGYAPKMELKEGIHNEVEWIKSIRNKLAGG